MTRSHLELAAALVAAGGLSAQAADREAPASDHLFMIIGGVVLVFAAISFWRASNRFDLKRTLEKVLRVVLGIPLTWMVLAGVRELTGFPSNGLIFPLWGLAVIIVLMAGGALVPGPVRRLWASLFGAPVLHTHGTAHFGTARNATRHLMPAAPEDAFVLGVLRDAPRGADRRFRQDGHVLTCAPTGAGKGIGAVIPNLLEYPGSAFVLDFKGEIHAVTASARRALGHDVILIDPFGVAGAPTRSLNWLDTLDPADPDVISRAAGLADMLVIADGATGDSHWNDTARELLRNAVHRITQLMRSRELCGVLSSEGRFYKALEKIRSA